jgi:molybdate transport system substrate-binding protein
MKNRLPWLAIALMSFAIVGSLLISPVQFSANAQAKPPLIVSAAASLTDALQEIAPLYQKSNPNITVRYNFASSGTLQRQIENGAPADVFISAATQNMDDLAKKDLLVSATRRNLLSNELVLIVSANTSGITKLQDLSDRRTSRIAIGDPRSVPVGEYAQETLTKSKLWDALKPKYVLANSVRQVLQFVESGNAQAGIVYLTDAKTSSKVTVAQRIPATLHSPIVYPGAILKNSRDRATATAWLRFLSSPTARQVFEKYGFKVLR